MKRDGRKKSIKVSLGTVICIVIIILMCIGLAFFYLKNNELKSQMAQFEQDAINKNATINDLQTKINKISETINENETNVKSNSEKEINAEKENNNTDIVSIAMFYGDENLYAYLRDGYLYYYRGQNEKDNSNVKKYTELSNVEKIKTYNFGTSVNPAIYLITSEGKVYYTYATKNGGANENLEFVVFEPMKNLKVDDILSKEGENIETFKVLLKNGNTETIKNDLGIF